MTKSYVNVVVAGGGTAGHIEPALAVASVLKSRGDNVIALGTPKGLETTLVPARGFELKLINPVPVPRKFGADLLKLPFRLVKTVAQTHKILKQHNTDVLVGFGGYVAAPGYIAAKLAGIPFIVHEANARVGMANKLGVKLGGVGLNAVPNSGMEGEVVGIPIRASISKEPHTAEAKERALKLWGLDPNRKTLFVTGGSQGAAALNAALEVAAEDLCAAGFQILHVYGAKNEPPPAREHHIALPYIEDMAAAYAVADLIVCRSGAMTVAEVTAAGLPAIYVPLPHGNGEQGLNAEPVVARKAAVLIPNSEVEARLGHTALSLLSDDTKLAEMRKAAIDSNAGNAAETIADIIEKTAQ